MRADSLTTVSPALEFSVLQGEELKTAIWLYDRMCEAMGGDEEAASLLCAEQADYRRVAWCMDHGCSTLTILRIFA
jgi:hypothetical protein